MKVFPGTKCIATSLSIAIFSTQCLFAHAPEAAIWQERRSRQLIPQVKRNAATLSALPLPMERLSALNSFDRMSRLPASFQMPAAGLSVLSLPKTLGRVQSIRVPKTNPAKGPVVLHIQDVHMNPEAQANIAGVVAELARLKKIDTVALEGAFGPIDFTSYRNYGDADTMKKLADFLLRKNGISGPVKTGMLLPMENAPAFTGIDDAAHYNANVRAFQRASKVTALAKKKLDEETRVLGRQRSNFNFLLLDFDDHVSDWRNGKIGMGAFVRFLTQKSGTVSFELEKFTAALDLEGKLDLARVESERKDLLVKLTLALSPQDTEDLMGESLAYRMGRTDHATFYGFLKRLCRRNNVDLRDYPNMSAYLQYVFLSDSIQSDRLFADIQRLEAEGYASRIKTPEERAWVRASRSLYLKKKLVDFALTTEEWKEYKQQVLSNQFSALSENLRTGELRTENFERFYREAEIRDGKMAANLQRIVGNKSGLNILVTGGFHSAGIDRRLVDAGATVISFVPKITKVEDEAGVAYLSVFNQDKTPLEKLFQGEKLFLAKLPTAGFADAPFDVLAIETMKGAAGLPDAVFKKLPLKRQAPVDIHTEKTDPRTVTETFRADNGKVVYRLTFDGEGHPVAGKATLDHSINFLPEALTVLFFLFMGSPATSPAMYVSILAASFFVMRFAWNAAILSHGFGHVLVKSAVDDDYKMTLAEIAEGRTVQEILWSLIPFHAIYTPGLSKGISLDAGDQDANKIRFKAAGGIAANVLVAFAAAVFTYSFKSDPFLFYAVAFTNLLLAVASVSDMVSIITGQAWAFGCGILMINMDRDVARHGTDILPDVVLDAVEEGLYVMARRGSHTIGGGVESESPEGHASINNVKRVNGEGQNSFYYKRKGPIDLVRDFKPEFIRDIKALENDHHRMMSGIHAGIHVRLATTDGEQIKVNAQPFHVAFKPQELDASLTSKDQQIEFVQFSEGKLIVRKMPNEASGFANGDLFRGKISGKGPKAGAMFSDTELGEHYARRYSATLGTNDSERAAYKMFSLRVQGFMFESLRLAYDRHFVEHINDRVPQNADFSIWAERLQEVFMSHANDLYAPGATSLSQVRPAARVQVIQEMIDKLGVFTFWQDKDPELIRHFAASAFRFFTKNDAMEAARMFMAEVSEDSTFGLAFHSALEPRVDVFISRAQPVSVVMNVTKRIAVTCSVGDVAAAIVQRLSDKGDKLLQIDLKMEKEMGPDGKERGGEIARYDGNTGELRIFSLVLNRYLTDVELAERMYTPKKENLVSLKTAGDKVADDLQVAPLINERVKSSWSQPGSWNWVEGRKLAETFAASARKLDRINRALHNSGTMELVKNGAPDIFIVYLGEESMDVANYIKEMMKISFPVANIEAVNANQYLHNLDNHPLRENTVALILDSGNAFPVVRSAEEFGRLAAQHKAEKEKKIAAVPVAIADGDTQEFYNLEVEDPTTEATWKMLELYYKRELPQAFLMTPKLHTDASRAMPADAAHVIQTHFAPEIDGSFGLTWSQILTAIELHHHVASYLREQFPHGAPLGMTTTQKDIDLIRERHLTEMQDKVRFMVGMDVRKNGDRVPLEEASEYQNLSKVGYGLSDYFTEQPRSIAASSIYLWITVLFTGGIFSWVALYALPLVARISLSPLLGVVIAYVVGLVFRAGDAAIYQWFKYGYVRVLRRVQGREAYHRDGTPTVVFTDDQWANAERSYLSSRFALARKVVEPNGIYGAQQTYTLERKHAKDLRRGTMVFLNIPRELLPDKLGKAVNIFLDQLYRAAKLITKQVGSFQSIYSVGALRVGVGDGPEVNEIRVSRRVAISTEERPDIESQLDDPELSGRILYLQTDSILRLLATTVICQKMTEKVSKTKVGIKYTPWYYDLSYDYANSQNAMEPTTTAPISAPPLVDHSKTVETKRAKLNGTYVEPKPEEKNDSDSDPAIPAPAILAEAGDEEAHMGSANAHPNATLGAVWHDEQYDFDAEALGGGNEVGSYSPPAGDPAPAPTPASSSKKEDKKKKSRETAAPEKPAAPATGNGSAAAPHVNFRAKIAPPAPKTETPKVHAGWRNHWTDAFRLGMWLILIGIASQFFWVTETSAAQAPATTFVDMLETAKTTPADGHNPKMGVLVNKFLERPSLFGIGQSPKGTTGALAMQDAARRLLNDEKFVNDVRAEIKRRMGKVSERDVMALMEKVEATGLHMSFDAWLPDTGPEPDSLLVVTLHDDAAPANLEKFMKGVNRFAREAQAVVDVASEELAAKIRPLAGKNVSVIVSGELFDASTGRLRLRMAVLDADLREAGVSIDKRKLRLAVPEGAVRDWTGLLGDTPLLTPELYWLDALLNAAQVLPGELARLEKAAKIIAVQL